MWDLRYPEALLRICFDENMALQVTYSMYVRRPKVDPRVVFRLLLVTHWLADWMILITGI